jgi:hypothetical protein
MKQPAIILPLTLCGLSVVTEGAFAQPSGASKVPEAPGSILVNDVPAPSMNNRLQLRIVNDTGPITSDSLAIFAFPPGVLPEPGRHYPLSVRPQFVVVTSPEPGASREAGFDFSVDGEATMGTQDTLVLLVSSRIGPVCIKRIVMRYTSPSVGGRRPAFYPSMTIKEEILLKKR